jgi:hypothetical protein
VPVLLENGKESVQSYCEQTLRKEIMTTPKTPRNQSRAGKALASLIRHLEAELKNSDREIASKAASDLKDLLMDQAKRQDEQDEREIRKLEAESRRALAVPIVAPANRDALIAQLQAEVEAKRGNV